MHGRMVVTVDVMGVEEVVAYFKVYDFSGGTETSNVG
jgi:hypothetical protein